MVAFTLASNAVGSIPDAGRIAAAAHGVGALAWADGVHLAPHRRLRARELGLDVVLCSPYKFFGPHLGIAAIGPTWPSRCPPTACGPAAEDPPGHRFETGTQSHEAIAGALAAIEYLRELGDGDLDAAFALIEQHETQLTARFLSGLPEGVELYGIRTRRGPHADLLLQRATAGRRARSPSCWASASSTCGTATTTRSSRCAPWAWPTAAAPSGPASCTTRPRTRSTGCSRRWPTSPARGG